NQLCTRDVSAMLGTVDQGQVVRLVEAIAHRDGVQLLELVAQFSEFSPNYAHALDSMASLLHRVAIEQAVPGAVDNSQGDQEELLQLARNLSAEDVQLFYQIAIQSRRDLSLAPDPRTGFEMALLRMLAFMPNATQQPQPVALASSSVQAEAPAQATGPDSIASQPAQAPQPVEQTSAPAVSQEPEQVSPPVAPVSVEPHQAASTPADQTTASLAASQEGLNPVPKPEPSPSRSPSEGSSPPVEESEEPAPEAALPVSAQIPEVNKADDVTPVMASTPLMESAPVVENAPVPVVESAGAEDELTTSEAPVEMAVAQGESVVFNDGPPIDAYDDEDFAPEAEADYAEFLMGQEVELVAEPAPTEPAVSVVESDPGDERAQVRPSEEGPLLANEAWVTFIDRLGLTGLTQNLAMQAVLQKVDGQHLVFVMDARHYDLLNQNHRQRIIQALETVLGAQLNVEFVIGEAEWESPARYRRRLQAERQAQAVAEIKADPHVAALVQAFDATVLEESIKPL